MAAGKIMAARAAHTPLAPGCIVDGQGQPTTDPEQYHNGGALLPFAAHKGYGLSVMAELLGQALTGADRLSETGSGDHRRSGALFWAIDLGIFRPAGEARAAARRIVDRLRAVPPAPGVDRVRTPGEPEAQTRRVRAARGIELPGDTWQAIAAAARQAGLSPADLPQPAPVS